MALRYEGECRIMSLPFPPTTRSTFFPVTFIPYFPFFAALSFLSFPQCVVFMFLTHSCCAGHSFDNFRFLSIVQPSFSLLVLFSYPLSSSLRLLFIFSFSFSILLCILQHNALRLPISATFLSHCLIFYPPKTWLLVFLFHSPLFSLSNLGFYLFLIPSFLFPPSPSLSFRLPFLSMLPFVFPSSSSFLLSVSLSLHSFPSSSPSPCLSHSFPKPN